MREQYENLMIEAHTPAMNARPKLVQGRIIPNEAKFLRVQQYDIILNTNV